ncbi:rCG24469 [Rattus norvegicus]|uniref:RCG24469 n=1 Tax=Rattus norvegicus TaxID=10116 RepID=A6KJC1_RAT|nr:rCG24469 [Rattus norvegicus]
MDSEGGLLVCTFKGGLEELDDSR